MLKNILYVAIAAPLALSSAQTLADSPWSIKLGTSYISPKSDNGDLLGGALKAEVSSEIGLTPSIEYAFTPNIVAELLLATPYEHDVEVTGGALVDAEVASFQHLPPTLSVKYVFTPEAAFSAYVGVGINYTLVFEEETKGVLDEDTLKGDDSFGLAVNAGLQYLFPDSPWGISADIRYIDIESDLSLNGEDIGTLEVDPVVMGVSLSYSF